jgi:predicted nucleic acid-binding Zn ribbon protein
MKILLSVEINDLKEIDDVIQALRNLKGELQPKEESVIESIPVLPAPEEPADRTPDRPMEPFEHAMEEITSSRKCIVCGEEFDPPMETSKTCSKKCYMKDYFSKRPNSKIDPDLAANLQEIKETYPEPKGRPEFKRDFNS